MRSRPIYRAIAAALVLASTLVACREGGDIGGSRSSDRTTVPANPTEGGADGYQPKPLEWSSCGTGFECATLAVPLDYAEPAGDTIDIAVTRKPATGERIGPLFVNPGGPGASARDAAKQLAALFDDRLLERFDIVGVDPRGVGESTPLHCGVPPAELYGVDPTIEDRGDTAALMDVSTRYVDDCERKHAALLPHIATPDVARDMDVVRAAMGDEQLTYVGYSYGTAIGQVYAGLFPQRVRAMVLDGVVELGISGLAGANVQADGFEHALANFATDCDKSSGCPLAPGTMRAVEQLLAIAERPGGVSAPSASRPMGPGEANLGIGSALYSQQLWPILQDAIDDALNGDGSRMVLLADSYLSGVSFEDYFAVGCVDQSWPKDPQAILDAAKASAQHAPHFGEALVTDYVRCALWPVPPQPLALVTGGGAPPIVVVSTTGDPATPYESGVRVADQLERGVLITNVGEGHTAYAQGDACVDDLVNAYLLDLALPPEGARC
jgi:pimeloyl-ACP methyl ester carboxylesterase